MLADVIACLMCPVCGADLTSSGGSVRCDNGHSFDVARQGYVNLLPGRARPGTADTKEMVAARETFLESGHFEAIAAAVAAAVTDAVGSDVPGCVVEAGAGTGYHLAGVLDRMPDRYGVAIDLSKHAAARAAAAHPRLGSVVADTWARMPVGTGAAAAVLDVFAPRNAEEFARILDPSGALIVVTPTQRHMGELVLALGLVTVDPEKESRTSETLSGAFERITVSEVDRELSLTPEDVSGFVAMGPSARHLTAAETAERVAALPEPVSATASATVSVYRPKRRRKV